MRKHQVLQSYYKSPVLLFSKQSEPIKSALPAAHERNSNVLVVDIQQSMQWQQIGMGSLIQLGCTGWASRRDTGHDLEYRYFVSQGTKMSSDFNLHSDMHNTAALACTLMHRYERVKLVFICRLYALRPHVVILMLQYGSLGFPSWPCPLPDVTFLCGFLALVYIALLPHWGVKMPPLKLSYLQGRL